MPEPTLLSIAPAMKRFRLVTIGFVAVIALAFCLALAGACNALDYSSAVAFLTVVPALGPFAGCFTTSQGAAGPQVWAVGIPCLAAIFAHPAFPHWTTAILTVLGLLAWLLFGVAYAYSGV